MKVAINTLAHVTGGGITYFENVLPRLEGDGNEYVVLVPRERGKITRMEYPNVRYYEVPVPTDSVVARLAFEQLFYPVLLLLWDIDVVFSPADLTPLLAPCPIVLAVRNPNPYFEKADLERTLYRKLKFRIQRWLTWLSARRAAHVFFVSEFSRRISNEFLGLADDKISVIYHGIDKSVFQTPNPPCESLRQSLTSATPYILCVSTINEHKNYETLLRGFARLPDELREEYDLIVAGRNSAPGYFETLLEITESEGIEDDVTFLGEVEYDEVPWLYANATLYVLPSKLETFGHTLVEAMASGVPIVAADATCIPEVTDGAAALFDPDNPDDLAATVEAVLGDAARREKLVSAGHRRVEDFSWDETVERTRALFRTVHEGAPETTDD